MASAINKVTDPGIEAIRNALERPVIEVFRREIAALKTLPRAAAYDAVMNDPKILDQCFRLFRARPDLFEDVVFDAQRQPVTNDDSHLSCGRTLGDAVALVVRASARRYFRAKLDFRSRFKAPTPKKPLLFRLAVAMGLAKPPVVKPPPKQHARSDALYRAISDYLKFDWQVQLIPHYTPMSPAIVSDLGLRLLEIREAAELQALAAPGNVPKDGRPPLLLDDARRLMIQGRDTIDPEILWRVVQQMDLARLFPKSDSNQIRRAVAQVSATHSDVLRALLPVLGGDIRRFTAFMMIAYTTFGEQRFKQEFCNECQVYAARKLAERLGSTPAPPPCLEDMKAAYQRVLGTAYTGGVETPQPVSSGEKKLLNGHPELAKALDALGKSKAAPFAISH